MASFFMFKGVKEGKPAVMYSQCRNVKLLEIKDCEDGTYKVAGETFTGEGINFTAVQGEPDILQCDQQGES